MDGRSISPISIGPLTVSACYLLWFLKSFHHMPPCKDDQCGAIIFCILCLQPYCKMTWPPKQLYACIRKNEIEYFPHLLQKYGQCAWLVVSRYSNCGSLIPLETFVFSFQGNIILCGLRNGAILTVDARQKCQDFASQHRNPNVHRNSSRPKVECTNVECLPSVL